MPILKRIITTIVVKKNNPRVKGNTPNISIKSNTKKKLKIAKTLGPEQALQRILLTVPVLPARLNQTKIPHLRQAAAHLPVAVLNQP
jgi:hypothetical protein